MKATLVNDGSYDGSKHKRNKIGGRNKERGLVARFSAGCTMDRDDRFHRCVKRHMHVMWVPVASPTNKDDGTPVLR